MARQIAVVKLAPGEIGYYDDLSKLFLNIQNPIGRIYEDMNHNKVRQAIANGQLELVTGTFASVATPLDTVEGKILLNKTPELIQSVETTVYINKQQEKENSAESKPKKKKSKRKKEE